MSENLNVENNDSLLQTPLWDLHCKLGGKMVPFAGYDMPVQYQGGGVMAEHLHTRENAGLFDVSHMGQAILTADTDPAALLEHLVPGDIIGLENMQMRYTLLLNNEGCILDDLMVTRIDDKTLFLVVNAACKDKDFAYIQENLPGVKLEYMADRALLALQGPKAEAVLTRHIPQAADLTFMKMTGVDNDIYISRSGYTGEDGFEISIPGHAAEDFAQKLLAEDEVQPIGLGARDSLRLEAGLCLYGHDIDDATTPVEANLKWTVAKRRREEKNFKGAGRIMAQFEEGVSRLRVGVKPLDKAPVREGVELADTEGNTIGIVTSGTFGPSLGGPVAMGYVEKGFAKPGTEIQAMLRGKAKACEVVKLPFIQPNYKH